MIRTRPLLRASSIAALTLATRDIIEGLGTLYTWNVWSPRFGVTLKLTPDGRTMLRGSFGRFNEGVLTGEL